MAKIKIFSMTRLSGGVCDRCGCDECMVSEIDDSLYVCCNCELVFDPVVSMKNMVLH